jgi:hypothetical protein
MVLIWCLVVLFIVINSIFAFPGTTSHADITSNTNAAALLRYYAAKLSGFCKTGKLLGRENGEGGRLDLETVGNVSAPLIPSVGSLRIHVVPLLQLFVEREGQTVFSLMPDRKVGEDEVSSWLWTIQISHASDRGSSQNGKGRLRLGLHSALRKETCILEGSKQKEIGSVGECDVGFAVGSFEDTKLNNWRRIDWATVGRRCTMLEAEHTQPS